MVQDSIHQQYVGSRSLLPYRGLDGWRGRCTAHLNCLELGGVWEKDPDRSPFEFPGNNAVSPLSFPTNQQEMWGLRVSQSKVPGD